jgi:hypothetical protein
MQEDCVGPLHSLGRDYETCSLCGYPYPAHMLKPHEGEPVEGIRSEREDVCPECGRLLNRGDEPGFPLDDEGEGVDDRGW